MCKIVEEMVEEGKMEGKTEEKKLTVLRMLEEGTFTLDMIAKISGLPLEEVKKLQEEKRD